jgi:hypothetical protein
VLGQVAVRPADVGQFTDAKPALSQSWAAAVNRSTGRAGLTARRIDANNQDSSEQAQFLEENAGIWKAVRWFDSYAES